MKRFRASPGRARQFSIADEIEPKSGWPPVQELNRRILAAHSWRMTMITAKTLMLAGLAALSLAACTATVREGGGPSIIGSNDYSTVGHRAVPSGSSDVYESRSWFDSGWAGNNSPYRFQYGTLNAGG
jgi:hypothetical protein